MSVVCDRRPMPDPLAACNGGGVRQGKRKEVERGEEEEEEETGTTNRPGFYIDDVEENGSDRSSIGVASNCSSSLTSSFGDEEDEVESKPSLQGGLGSFDSLEESLPIKRGLSNFFSGKSKSFTTLSSVVNSSSSATDLAKKENPFNKRRRVLLACNRRASCSSFIAHLPPMLSPQREVDEKDGEGTDGDSDEEKPTALLVDLSRKGTIKGRNGLMNRSLISAPRSYSLSDLQQHV